MSVRRDTKTRTYTVECRFVDNEGRPRRHKKRGFPTSTEAKKYEREYLERWKNKLTMTFKSFVENVYLPSKAPRLKKTTLATKKAIIDKWLIPEFGDKPMCDITPADLEGFENKLLALDLSATYIHTICNQLSAVFNYACTHYRLHGNPMRVTGKVGTKNTEHEMHFWTPEEFNRFIPCIEDKPESYMVFLLLYWLGLRCGEALALRPCDIDFATGVIRVRHNYQRVNGEDLITTPKTRKSKRDVVMPDFLRDELEDYLTTRPELARNERIFAMTKHKLRHEMQRGCKAAGMTPIRVHDLRHSHVSLLINLGMSPYAIADRVGHESVYITETYSHLFPSTQQSLVDALNKVGGERYE